CKPVLRVGGATNMAWLDRRSIYTNAEEGRIRISAVQPGGANSSFINILNGGSVPAFTNGVLPTVDKFDVYSYEAFAAAKYRGFSVCTDWFFRNIDNFKAPHVTGGGLSPIVYSANIPGPVTGAGAIPAFGVNTGTNALFTRGGVFDMGTQNQIGYFIV